MTIYQTLLARGYFPKELPPAFFTDLFARYARTKRGDAVLETFKPLNNYTHPVRYNLALPGRIFRDLSVPHPGSFPTLARLAAKNLARLLKRASASKFSRSRPVYSTSSHRALHPALKPSNLGRERANARAGATYLLKADISHFYPALYTHAVGWAVDPPLRKRANWGKTKYLGKRLDQAFMDLQGKVSQGVPIGNDVSYLLSEVVLADVDRNLKVRPESTYRWFDDYEIACSSLGEAEEVLARLQHELGRYQLRLNPSKTDIVPLPAAANVAWQEPLREKGVGPLGTDKDMVRFFDLAFQLSVAHEDSPVLLYAMGILFRLRVPELPAGAIAVSGITQALLREPGAAQKAFALLTFWRLNGYAVDQALIARTITKLIEAHEYRGASSDVAWALAYCLDSRIALDKKAGRALSQIEDDAISILALDMYARGLLPEGYSSKRLAKLLSRVDLDGPHWLLGYESVRHGWLTASAAAVAAHHVFSDLLAKQVTFYRTHIPVYANIVHPGSAPEWAVDAWIKLLLSVKESLEPRSAVLQAIRNDLVALDRVPSSHDNIVADLLQLYTPEEFNELIAFEVGYWE